MNSKQIKKFKRAIKSLEKTLESLQNKVDVNSTDKIKSEFEQKRSDIIYVIDYIYHVIHNS